MNWIQLSLPVADTDVELLEDLLLLSGAAAVSLLDDADQPVYEPPTGTTPIWQSTLVGGLFPATTDTEALLQQLRCAWAVNLPELTFPAYRLEILEDKDWEKAWMEHFMPIHCGHQLWICPSWRPVVDPQAYNLMLDPGLAFGTGTHPTTALCLEWIARQDWHQQLVIDYGCGSGILALACLLLGCRGAYALDHDQQALLATQTNAERNQLATDKLVTCLPEGLPVIKADVMIANILANPLINLAPRLADLTQGQIILSGILDSQTASVVAAYEPYFTIHHIASKDGWVMLHGLRR